MKQQHKTLFRSDSNTIIAGVCAGIGEYFEVDPIFIRILFVLITLFGGSGIFIYFVLWILIPSRRHGGFSFHSSFQENIHEIKEKAQNFVKNTGNMHKAESSQRWLGFSILFIGVLFLFSNFGYFHMGDIIKLWPLLLVGLGISIFFRS